MRKAEDEASEKCHADDATASPRGGNAKGGASDTGLSVSAGIGVFLTEDIELSLPKASPRPKEGADAAAKPHAQRQAQLPLHGYSERGRPDPRPPKDAYMLPLEPYPPID